MKNLSRTLRPEAAHYYHCNSSWTEINAQYLRLGLVVNARP